MIDGAENQYSGMQIGQLQDEEDEGAILHQGDPADRFGNTALGKCIFYMGFQLGLLMPTWPQVNYVRPPFDKVKMQDFLLHPLPASGYTKQNCEIIVINTHNLLSISRISENLKLKCTSIWTPLSLNQ